MIRIALIALLLLAGLPVRAESWLERTAKLLTQTHATTTTVERARPAAPPAQPSSGKYSSLTIRQVRAKYGNVPEDRMDEYVDRLLKESPAPSSVRSTPGANSMLRRAIDRRKDEIRGLERHALRQPRPGQIQRPRTPTVDLNNAPAKGKCPEGGAHVAGITDNHGNLHCDKCGRFMSRRAKSK
jgi:hypothetical protein